MKKILILGLCFFWNHFIWAMPELDPTFGKISASCQKSSSPKHVWLFKQWHLGPKVNTFLNQDFSKLDQERNQTAIYLQIAKWIETNQVDLVLAEGCQENELTEKSSIAINGWNISQLKKVALDNNFSQIVSSVPLKLEAKFASKVKTVCGDDLALIEKNGLAFSDARAAIGFLSRINQYKGEDKSLTRYLEAAREAYKLSSKTKKDAIVKHIVGKLKAAVVAIEKATNDRNQILIRKIILEKNKEQTVVYGGIHAEGIVRGLEENQINCDVVTPVGYQDSETELLTTLKAAVEKL